MKSNLVSSTIPNGLSALPLSNPLKNSQNYESLGDVQHAILRRRRNLVVELVKFHAQETRIFEIRRRELRKKRHSASDRIAQRFHSRIVLLKGGKFRFHDVSPVVGGGAL